MNIQERSNDYCTLYVVRHGETDWNVQGKIQGHTDIPLNENGIRQAKKLYEKLKDIRFNAIFSSDLLRAKQTAEVIALEHKIAVQTTKALRERWFGKYEGVSFRTHDKEIQEMFKKYKKLTDANESSPPELEGDEELMGRFIPFVREIAVAYRKKMVLMVSHGGAMRTFLVHLGYASYDELIPGSIDNLAYIKLESDGIDFFIRETHGIQK